MGTRTGAVGLRARTGRPSVAWVRTDGTVLPGTARVGAWTVGGRHRVPGRYGPLRGWAVPLVRPVRVGLRPGAGLDDGPLALVRARAIGWRALPTLVGAWPRRGGRLRVSRTVSLRAVPVGLALRRRPPVLGCPALGLRVRGGLAARRTVVPPATGRVAPVRRGRWAGLAPAVTRGLAPAVVARTAPTGAAVARLAPAWFAPAVASRIGPAWLTPTRLDPAGSVPLRRRHGLVAPVDAGTAPTTGGIDL
ncbi:hypothetical protein AB0893_27620 [Micromonospora aurantiaca]|uniref:hypothetical protein n=1 Tax=Micromonospora aurantiaca (nom. illeg.) TaxID=47850 RepID=UPI003455C86F